MSQKLMLGHKVRRLRRESGLSQAQMAEQLGISPSYLNLIEHNHYPELEIAAEDLCRKGKLDGAALYPSLARHLETAHRIKVQLMPQSIMGAMIRRHDPHRGRVLLSEMLPASGRAFQLACEV